MLTQGQICELDMASYLERFGWNLWQQQNKTAICGLVGNRIRKGFIDLTCLLPVPPKTNKVINPGLTGGRHNHINPVGLARIQHGLWGLRVKRWYVTAP